jgi:serine/threonine protein kinase/tetratricopeptide (TPR) repeat protein
MNERTIFLAALDRDDPVQRSAFLDAACAGDAALRQRVEALLMSHGQAGHFVDKPAPQRVAEALALPGERPRNDRTDEGLSFPEQTSGYPPAAVAPAALPDGVGAVIGPYTLVELLGEGGMGAVFRAEQSEPVQRQVALKIIKPGLDSRHIFGRFEAERQALALMDHPNIARVFDAGTTPDRRPFFVMELVQGVPLTRYCDEHRLTPRQRLELFVSVCQAVQHAHQKGIIHRDLKPSNVLVAQYDGQPVPKVIDFGIAKATEAHQLERTTFTEVGQIVGTLEYMSPEQAELNQLDIDTRSDIYSLGVLLYELLTGSTPLDRKRLKSAALLEMLRVIREEEPPKPSTRLSESRETLPAISAQRQTEPARLTKLVRGELDWIVMKALDKDRNRRYESAIGFAQDIQRYLADEPVLACPPSAVYRLRKFVRRHQAGVLTTAAVFLVALLAAGGAGWVWWDQAERLTETDRTVSVALARADQWAGQAEGGRAATSQVGKEVLAVWGQADAALAEAEAALQTGKGDELMRQRIADVRQRLAKGRRTTEQQQAQALRRETLLRDLDEARMKSATWGADGFDLAGGAAKYLAAFAAYGLEVKAGDTAELARRIRAEEKTVRDALIVALDDWASAALHARTEPSEAALRALAVAADDDPWRKRYRAAWADRDREALRNLSAEARRSSLPPASLILLAASLYNVGEYEEALTLLRWARGQHPADFWLHFDLGMALGRKSEASHSLIYPGEFTPVDLEEAIGCYRAALALRPHAAAAHTNLAFDLGAKGLRDEALAEFRKAVDLDPTIAKFHINLGKALKDMGQLDEAIAEHRKAIHLVKDNAAAHNDLGVALQANRLLDEAIAQYREAILLEKDWALAHYNLGTALQDKGELDEAIASFRKAIHFKKDLALAHTRLGTALRAKGQLDKAIDAFHEAIRINYDDPGPHNALGNALMAKGQPDAAIDEYRAAIRLKADSSEFVNGLGTALMAKDQPDAAIEAFTEAIRLKKDNAEAHYNLGNALRAKGLLGEAIARYREAIQLKEDFAEAHNNLGNALRATGRLDEAIAEYRAAIRHKEDLAVAHFNLGDALRATGQLDEAIAEYWNAIRFAPEYAEAHCNLAVALRRQGEFRRALEAARRGHELGMARGPAWRYPSAEWVQKYEHLAELEDKLPGILERKTTPTSPAECIELAEMCTVKRLHRAAARFYEEAFDAQPKLANNLGTLHRYKAACAAALAGCGQGKDADKLDDKERTRLRGQALDWLRSDLAAWGWLLEKEKEKLRPVVIKQMQHWLANNNFAGVRGPEALDRLPEKERQGWQNLWDDASRLLDRAQGKMPPEQK